MSGVQRGVSLRKLIVELIFLSVGEASLRQPREFYGRLDADFSVMTVEERERKYGDATLMAAHPLVAA